MYEILKRVLDLFLLMILVVPILLISFFILIIIKSVSPGPALHWSNRIGAGNIIFKMPKFRTMDLDTPQVATHLLRGENYIFPFGRILRKLSLDELPQLWSVFLGEMSFVGPRPALFNQKDLIEQRTELGIHKLAPGITGWAQVNGRDEISIEDKVQLDYEYLKACSVLFDIKILFITIEKVLRSKDVVH